MQEELKVALLQSDLVWENPEKNRGNFEKKINAITEDVDLIILPEMFTTGFTMNPVLVSETMRGTTVGWMKEIAYKNKVAVTGSCIIKEHDNYYNRLLFVHPDKQVEYYDKRHTFTLAGEHKAYTAGKQKIIINYKGWKICPLICYDLRFPVWSRNTENYDVLIYVANWPTPRIMAWDTLLKARAIENMSYCVGVNRVGLDANEYGYSGHSAAYNTIGEQISTITDASEQTDIVTLSADHIKKYRKKLQFLTDRDSFSLIVKP